MPLVSAHLGKLQVLGEASPLASRPDSFNTGLPALDDLLPGGAWARGAVHEILTQPGHGPALSFATILARAATQPRRSSQSRSFIAWLDPEGHLYPPALAAAGIDLDHVLLLKPQTPADLLWATAECLRCRGIRAVVAPLSRLSRIEARRIQLAAEQGGGVGILLRPFGNISREHAAATRWLVQPAPGDRDVQRWQVQLVHGHGGRTGRSVILEVCRETNHVRAFETVADRSVSTQIRRRA